MTSPPDAGFTLIEALVAMAVLAVAASGFVRATEGHIDTIAALEARAAGGWVADNALVEARVAGLAVTAATPMLGRVWAARLAARASDDPDVAALTVTAASGGTQSALRGFRDPVPPPPVAAARPGVAYDPAASAPATPPAPITPPTVAR